MLYKYILILISKNIFFSLCRPSKNNNKKHGKSQQNSVTETSASSNLKDSEDNLRPSTPSNLNETETETETETGVTTMSPSVSEVKVSLSRRRQGRREKKTVANHLEEARTALTEAGKKKERKVKYLSFNKNFKIL